MRRELLERRGKRNKGRVAIILFGALPATYLSWYALLILRVGYSLDFPKALIPYSFGIAGFYGTLTLWRTAFGFHTRFDTAGLIAGMIAIVPMVFLTRPGPLSIVAASPMLVAFILLLRQGFRRHPDELLSSNPRRLFCRGKSRW